MGELNGLEVIVFNALGGRRIGILDQLSRLLGGRVPFCRCILDMRGALFAKLLGSNIFSHDVDPFKGRLLVGPPDPPTLNAGRISVDNLFQCGGERIGSYDWMDRP